MGVGKLEVPSAEFQRKLSQQEANINTTYEESRQNTAKNSVAAFKGASR